MKTGRYALTVHTASGEQVDRFGDFLSLESRRLVNGVGELRFSLPEGHPALVNLTHLREIRLYRRGGEGGAQWQLENQGLLLRQQWESGTNEVRRAAVRSAPCITFTALHPNWLLATRCVAWKAGIDARSHFEAAAETVAKAMVRWNATEEASAEAGRERDGQYTLVPLSVQADAGGGALMNWSCAYDNLLESLQRLSTLGGGDFELVSVPGGYEFRWYSGQLGNDLRSEVFFALERGNLSNPRLDLDRRNEQSAAVVGGRGVGILRQVMPCYGENYSTANDIETFVYGLQASDADGLAVLGAQALQRSQPLKTLDFDVLQTPGCTYGIHYQIGDRVSVRSPFEGEVFDAKVSAVSIRLDAENGEQISVTLETSPSTPTVPAAFLTADGGENETLEGGDFTLEDVAQGALFSLDAGEMGESYLTDGVSGGGFAPLP